MRIKDFFICNPKLAALAIVGTFAVGGGIATNFNDHTETVTITEKERINKDDKSKYIVCGLDENGEIHTYENTDALLRFKWNSSDIQGSLKEGETYKLKLVGYRFGLLSWYENILSYEHVEEPAEEAIEESVEKSKQYQKIK